MIGIQMGEPVAALRKQLLFEASIFTGSASDPNTIRLLPPLNVTDVETDVLVGTLSEWAAPV
jgi:acetylornithine aminotransferase